MTSGDCPNCGRSNDATSTISCGGCSRSIHVGCVGLPADEAVRVTRSIARSRNVRYCCDKCSSASDRFDSLQKTLLDLIEEKFKNIEQTFAMMSTPNTQPESSPQLYENITAEVVDRIQRANNIIISNVPEVGEGGDSPSDRVTVGNVLQQITGTDAIEPLSVSRLGKVGGAKPRLIRVRFGDSSIVPTVLKQKRFLRRDARFSKVFVQPDRTPRQRDFFRGVRRELEERRESGEVGLSIRYINGTPSIVTHDEGDRPETGPSRTANGKN